MAAPKTTKAPAAEKPAPEAKTRELSGYLEVPLTLIDLSPTNPRKKVNPAALVDLAESIRQKGVIEPCIVRLAKDHRYELVIGSRRFLGSKEADRTHLPCLLRTLTDVEALELQLIENNQRADVTPLEEGDGFVELMRMGKSLAEVADRIGRPARYVEQRVRVARATPEVRSLFEDETIGLGSALLVTALPPDRQITVANTIRTATAHGDRMPVNDVLEIISDFDHELRNAPFDVTDATLVPAAGTCGACPRNSATQLTLIGEPGGDAMCLDETCWEAKAKAHEAALLASAEKRGLRIVKTDQTHQYKRPEAEAWEIRNWQGEVCSDEVDGDHEDGDVTADGVPVVSRKTWGDVTQDRVLVVSRNGVFEAVPPETIARIVQETTGRAPATVGTGEDYAAQQKKRQLEVKAETTANERAMAVVVASVSKHPITDEQWRILALALAVGQDRSMAVCARRGIEAEKAKSSGGSRDYYGALAKFIDEARNNVQTLRGLVFELALFDGARTAWAEGNQKKAWKAALEASDVDIKEMTKTARKEVFDADKAKAKAKAARDAKSEKTKGANSAPKKGRAA